MKSSCKLILGIKYYPERKIKVNTQITRNWGILEKFLKDNEHFMFTELRLRPENTRKADMLCEKWDKHNKHLNFFGISLTDVNNYNEDLKALFNVDCDGSFEDLKYNKYPIDCSDNFLKLMTDEELPEDLDDLLNFETPLDKLCGCIGRWNLYLISGGLLDD